MSIGELAKDYFAWVEEEKDKDRRYRTKYQGLNVVPVAHTFERYLKTKLDSPTNQSRKEL